MISIKVIISGLFRHIGALNGFDWLKQRKQSMYCQLESRNNVVFSEQGGSSRLNTVRALHSTQFFPRIDSVELQSNNWNENCTRDQQMTDARMGLLKRVSSGIDQVRLLDEAVHVQKILNGTNTNRSQYRYWLSVRLPPWRQSKETAVNCIIEYNSINLND